MPDVVYHTHEQVSVNLASAEKGVTGDWQEVRETTPLGPILPNTSVFQKTLQGER